MCVQVSPPSPERQMPFPTETELRVQLSPVPTQTTFGSEGSNATAPIDWTPCLSKTDLNVVPPSTDFQTPPEAAPTNNVTLPSASTRPATAAMRPLIAAEPMFRAPMPETVAESSAGEAAATLSTHAPRSPTAAFIGPLLPEPPPCPERRRRPLATATLASASSQTAFVFDDEGELRGPLSSLIGT